MDTIIEQAFETNGGGMTAAEIDRILPLISESTVQLVATQKALIVVKSEQLEQAAEIQDSPFLP